MLESSDMDLPTDNNVEILRVMTKFEQDNIADPVTNNHFWKRYFRGKADVFKGFVDGMKDVYDDIDKICKDESTRGSNEHIRAVYTILRDVDKKLIDKMEHDGNLCLAIKNDFGDFKDEDKDDLILHNKEHQLTHARKQLLEQRRAVERKKEKYHRTAFKLEKAEIKKAIAEKEEDIKKHEKTFRHLQKKVEKRLKKYQKEHAKLPNLTTIVKEKSSDCSTVRTEVDVKRAEFILEKLEQYCNEAKTRSGDLQKAEFEKIDVNELVKKRQIIEDFKVPRTTEKYEGTKNKHELFEQVRKEMAEDRERRQTGEREDDSSDDDDDDEVKAPNLRARSRRRLAQNETPVVAFNSTVNGGDESPRPGPSGVHAHGSVEPDDGEQSESPKKPRQASARGRGKKSAPPTKSDNEQAPPTLTPPPSSFSCSSLRQLTNLQEKMIKPGSPRVKGIGSKYLVTTAYRKKAANEMNLPRGKIVKLIMPPNDKGMAFGEKKGKIGGRKIKGYFPMECVVPAD